MQLRSEINAAVQPPVRRRLARQASWIAAAVVLSIGGLVLMLRPQPIAVDLAEIAAGPLRVTIDEEGKARVKEVYVISAPIAGKVLRAPLDPGDPVIMDETVVAIIQPVAPSFLDARMRKELEAAVAAARSAVELAETEVRQALTENEWAASELSRTRALAQTSVASQRSLERARLDVDKQRAALLRAKANAELRRAELASAEARLMGPESAALDRRSQACCVEVRSPQSGTVLRQTQDSETVIAAGASLLEVGDPTQMEVLVELLSTDAVKIASGAAATIEGAGLSRTIAAKVRRIEPAGFTKVSALGIEEQRVKTLLDIVSPREQWQRIGHDFRVFVRITEWSSENVLRVPLSALFRQGERWAVFKLDNGRARLTNVEIGHRNSELAELLGGLTPGDKVVLHPSDRVIDGQRLTKR